MQNIYREQIKKLFKSHKFEKHAYVSELYIAKALKEFYSCKYILYGAGINAWPSVNYISRTEGIHIEYVVDRDPQRKDVEGIPVISCEEFSRLNSQTNEKWCALVSICAYNSNVEITRDIDKYLHSEGVLKIIKVASQLLTKTDWYDYFINNQVKFCKNIELFADDISKETYYEFVRAYLEGHVYRGKTFLEEDKYFLFSEDLIEHLEDELWINFGAYKGDTIYHFINQGYNFKQIYAVEGDLEVVEELQENISLLPTRLKNKIKIINYYFGQQEGQLSLDEYFADYKITYINMDIEGSEINVLKTAQNIIMKNRPVIAICVYHKKEDLVVIPDWLQRTVDEYSFFLRKHPSVIGGYFDGIFELNELVLYAVPNERLKIKVKE